MGRKRRRKRISARFFVFLGVLFAVILIAVCVYLLIGRGTDPLTYGSTDTRIDVSGVIIRDETVVEHTKFEKINFSVLENDLVPKGTLIATVFKRGYQDESMIALLNLQKEVYAAQKALLTEENPTLNAMNESIAAVEAMIRDTARGDSEKDVLDLEKKLKDLQSERINYLKSAVVPDQNLNGLYNQLNDQENSIGNWTTDIRNEVGEGIVSFYFDGYEDVLNYSKLSNINLSLVKNLIKNANTARSSESTSMVRLFRIISPNHWFLSYVSNIDDPMRLTAGEEYLVSFPDYSEAYYTATAREPLIFTVEDEEESNSNQGVVNILEFRVTVQNFTGIRTVNAVITKHAEGIQAKNSNLTTVNGVTCVYVKQEDSVLQVPVSVLAMDEENAIIRSASDQFTLAQGQRLVRP